MNPPLHPALMNLENQYNELVDSVQANHMTVDQAKDALKQCLVVDGGGALWGMNDDGDFVSGMPGGPLSVTAPHLYRPSQLPARDESVTAQPWGGVNLAAPPAGDNLDRSGIVGSQPAFPTLPNDNLESFETKAYKPVPTPKPKKAKSEAVGGLAGRVLGAASSAGDRLKSGGLGEKISNNKRTVGFILVAVAVLVGLFMFNQKEDAKGDVPQGGVTAEELASMPLDANGAPVPAAVPDPGQANTLLSALVSGDRSLTVGAVLNPGDASATAINTATFAGYKDGASGLTLSIGPAAATAEGAVADMSITDSSNATVLKTVKVNFAKTPEGGWAFATWPVLN